MKKLILVSIAVIALTGAAFAKCGSCGDKKAEPAKTEMKAQKKAKCDDCPMHKAQAGKKCGGMTCPEKIEGAETASKNVENGVEITVTGKDPETVAKIQELAPVHYSPKAEKCPGCPTTVPGAETKVANIENGIKVTITGKTPGTVKQIQEASAKEHSAGHQAAGPRGPGAARAAHQAAKEARTARKYTCAMKCVTSDKPGKCPKCGMPMEEVK